LTDIVVDPLDTLQQYSEELIRLEGPFLCYTPPSEAPPVAPTPALTKGYITFGSFNNLVGIDGSAALRSALTLMRV
jgi:protein O-GlcNAc transferase